MNIELTHAEFIKNKETDEVDILVLTIDLFDKDYQDFKNFLEQNENLITQSLRQQFKVHFGFNYGKAGGFTITENGFEMIFQEQFQNIRTEGKIGYPRTGEGRDKDDKFVELLADEIEKNIK